MEDSRKIQEILQDYSLQQIEKEIIRFHESSFDTENISYLLEMRKNIIDHNILQHQELILPDIVAFNEALRDALRTTYEKARLVFEANKALGEDVEIDARCFFAHEYPTLHPVQHVDCEELWSALCAPCWNHQYKWGVGYCFNPNESFNDFVGMNNTLKVYNDNWNYGLDEKLTKDLHLIRQFSDLFLKTNFAITDFIYCRDFYHKIKAQIIIND